MPKCLLIIDPVATNRIGLSALLDAARYDVLCAATAKDAQGLSQAIPDLVVLGLHSDTPAAAIADLRAAKIAPDAPILCIDRAATPLRRLQALRAGAEDLMPRAMPETLLLARLRGLIREGDAERECQRRRMTASSFGFAEVAQPFAHPARIACVMTESAPRHLPDMLRLALPHPLDVMSLDRALDEGEADEAPEAYLIACGLDGTALETLLPELRVRSHSRHIPTLVVYPDTRPELAIRALNLGANDIADDTSSGDELAIRIDGMLRRKRLLDRLRRNDEQSYRLAATDALTGLYNRRYAEAYLADLLMGEAEQSKGFAVMLVDLDHFKAINDTFGHSSGDRVLCEVADRLRDNLRAGDLVSRHGGEEFLVVLPNTDAAVAERTAERLRHAIGGTPVKLPKGAEVPVTASIGVGLGQEMALSHVKAKPDDFGQPASGLGLSITKLFDAADSALYRAKNSGRNRVEFSAA